MSKPTQTEESRIASVKDLMGSSMPHGGQSGFWNEGHSPWFNGSQTNQIRIHIVDQFNADAAIKECHASGIVRGDFLWLIQEIQR